jgi:hypothetical protein
MTCHIEIRFISSILKQYEHLIGYTRLGFTSAGMLFMTAKCHKFICINAHWDPQKGAPLYQIQHRTNHSSEW